MVKSYYQSSYKTREYLRPRLAKYQKLHDFVRSLDRAYSNLTGFAHMLPDFYLIGAQKSGTSALYDYLVQHPSVHPCITKEPRFFDKYYQRGINWYRSCYPFTFKKNLETKIFNRKFLTGEATERYLEHPHVPERIKKVTPNAKFIVLLRNPITRAYSHYNMRYESKKEDLSFEQAINQEEERTKGEFKKMLEDENYYSKEYFHHSYLDKGIYVEKLKRWMKIFPKEQFLILKSEDFFKNPNTTYNQVLKFLDLPGWKLQEYKKIGAGVYKRPVIESKLEKRLVEFFKPYNEDLYKFLGIRFDWDK
jgi:hypothetical protein